MESQTINLSIGGFAFLHDHPEYLPTRIRGEIDIGYQTTRFLGKVIHIGQSSSGPNSVGVQFVVS